MISKSVKKRVLVALSGGVDSSCAAAVLKESGCDVVAVTYKMWPKEECGSLSGKACCSLEAIVRARSVAEKLKIPYYVMDFSGEFKRQVIDYFCDEYLRGCTPNPCVVCNEKIKFGLLLRKAKELGAACIATGHYAKVRYDDSSGRFLLREGIEKQRDQTYFLFSLSQKQLGHVLFPLEGYTKRAARAYAKKLGLITYDAASSQDICFAQDSGYTEYLIKKRGVPITAGDIVDKNGKLLGKHKGIPFYTIGQRKRLGIAYREPLYVTAIDASRNRIIAGTKHEIMRRSLIVERVNWVSISGIKKSLKILAKIRYQHIKAQAVIEAAGKDCVKLTFASPQEAPTPGQAAVFYEGDILLGGGWIREAGE